MRANAMLLTFSFLVLAVRAGYADSVEVTLSPEQKAGIEQAVEQAYADPRVQAIVEQANQTQQSVSVDLDPPAPRPAAALSADSEIVAPQAPAAKPAPTTHFGVLIDAGLPDGVGGSVVYRPWKWLRAQVGGTTDGAAPGVRAGVTLAPWGWGPSLTLEAGHMFPGDLNTVISKFAGKPENVSWLEHVEYDYANAQLGLELGWQNRFLFYIHGGVSYIHGQALDFQQAVNQLAATNSSAMVTSKNPVASALVPSGKLGFVVYLF